jgi:hypothetical protein
LVELIHGGVHAVGVRIFERIRGAGDGLGNGWHLVWLEHSEDMVVESSITWTTDPDAEAWDFLGTEVDENGVEAIVAAGSAGFSEANCPERKGGIIKDNQDLLVGDFEIFCEIADSFAAEVHESLGLHECATTDLGGFGVPLGLKGKIRHGTARQLISDKKADVVACVSVLRAGIAEASHEPKCIGILHGTGVISSPRSLRPSSL